ncbi:hypothetical protein [Schaalia turicensis]|uniref:hypothetical protein n=1 Tax=Schaalia turicensis TaxID=131111 RepID=UPI0036A55B28
MSCTIKPIFSILSGFGASVAESPEVQPEKVAASRMLVVKASAFFAVLIVEISFWLDRPV